MAKYKIDLVYLLDCYDGAKKIPKTGTRTQARQLMHEDFKKVAGFSISSISDYFNQETLINTIINSNNMRYKIKPEFNKLAILSNEKIIIKRNKEYPINKNISIYKI